MYKNQIIFIDAPVKRLISAGFRVAFICMSSKKSLLEREEQNFDYYSFFFLIVLNHLVYSHILQTLNSSHICKIEKAIGLMV